MTDRSWCLSLSPARGFSLLEIMVVIVIISIIISFASLSFDTDPEKLQYEGERLTALMQLVSEEAIMNAREHRLVFTANGYAFEIFSDGEWLALTDGVFRPRELPYDLKLDLTLENEPVALDEVADPEQDIKAAILFLSSGEITPFELTISSTTKKLVTINNLSGLIEMAFVQ